MARASLDPKAQSSNSHRYNKPRHDGKMSNTKFEMRNLGLFWRLKGGYTIACICPDVGEAEAEDS